MISCIKDLTNFVFCFGYFSSSNFVGFVLTFPKNGVITNKQANSSTVLFLFCFISELKKKKSFDLLSSLICNEIFSSNSALD